MWARGDSRLIAVAAPRSWCVWGKWFGGLDHAAYLPTRAQVPTADLALWMPAGYGIDHNIGHGGI